MSKALVRESPSIQIGQRVEAEIESLNSMAEGIARLDGMTCFIPGLLPAECAEVRIEKVTRDFARANPKTLLSASPSRVVPPCPIHLQPSKENHFLEKLHCGGCQIQMMPRENQLALKRSIVCEAIERIAKLQVEVSPVVAGSPFNYRNKMAFSLIEEGNHLRWALRSVEQSDLPIPLPSCAIAREELWEGAERVLEILDREFGPPLVWNGEKGTVRSVTIRYHSGRRSPERTPADRASLEPSLIALFAVADLDTSILQRIVESLSVLPEVRAHFTYSDPRADAVHFDRARYLNRPVDRKPCWGEANLREDICVWHTTGEWATLVGPTSFLQVNDEMAAQLYSRVLELPFEKRGFAIDAYCGVGVLTRALAKQFDRVMGIELDTQSIKLARTTSRRLGDCRVEWVAEASEAVFGRMGRQSLGRGEVKPDAVILDPPRKGCQQEVLRALLSLRPSDIVYISCHPAALARDLKTLCKDVFRVVSVEPFDLFPQTHHVETLAYLKKR